MLNFLAGAGIAVCRALHWCCVYISVRNQSMQYTTLGRTGVTVSRLCLGCMSYGGGDIPSWAAGTKGWHVAKDEAREHFKLALDSGVTFFDTADVYSVGLSEEI